MDRFQGLRLRTFELLPFRLILMLNSFRGSVDLDSRRSTYRWRSTMNTCRWFISMSRP